MKPKLLTEVFRPVPRDTAPQDADGATAERPRGRADRRRVTLRSAVQVPAQPGDQAAGAD
ncbi:MAG: hypothetical protein ACK4TB_10185 [Gemmobacter sp.]